MGRKREKDERVQGRAALQEGLRDMKGGGELDWKITELVQNVQRQHRTHPLWHLKNCILSRYGWILTWTSGVTLGSTWADSLRPQSQLKIRPIFTCSNPLSYWPIDWTTSSSGLLQKLAKSLFLFCLYVSQSQNQEKSGKTLPGTISLNHGSMLVSGSSQQWLIFSFIKRVVSVCLSAPKLNVGHVQAVKEEKGRSKRAGKRGGWCGEREGWTKIGKKYKGVCAWSGWMVHPCYAHPPFPHMHTNTWTQCTCPIVCMHALGLAEYQGYEVCSLHMHIQQNILFPDGDTWQRSKHFYQYQNENKQLFSDILVQKKENRLISLVQVSACFSYQFSIFDCLIQQKW